MRTTPIYLDRLAAAMKAHGFDARRNQLLQIAAAAFGYHNANEFSAAARRGDLDAPRAEMLGTVTLDDQEVAVVRDPVANSPYALDCAFLEQVVEGERRESYGPSPYGGLLDLTGLLDAVPAKLATTTAGPYERRPEAIDVHVAVITHRHGEDVRVAATRAGLDRKVAAYCLDSWDEVEHRVGDFDVGKASDGEIVSAYFDAASDESLSTDVHSIPLAEAAASPRSRRPAGEGPLAPFRVRDGSDVAASCSHDVVDAAGRPVAAIVGWTRHPDDGPCEVSAAAAHRVAQALDGVFADAAGRHENLDVAVQVTTVTSGDRSEVLLALDDEGTTKRLAEWVEETDPDTAVDNLPPGVSGDDVTETQYVDAYFRGCGDIRSTRTARLRGTRAQLERLARVDRG